MVDTRSTLLYGITIAAVAFLIYMIDPTFFGLVRGYEGFESVPGATMGTNSNDKQKAGQNETPGAQQAAAIMANLNAAATPTTEKFVNEDPSGNKMPKAGEGFANMADITGPAAFDDAHGPAGCYPRDQLTPSELLPRDGNSVWAQQNPMGTGSLKGKNFLSAGALIGVNTVGQSLRNANYQLRSEPPNPQVPVSVWNNSTIEPDSNRRDLEIN
jgi:hypothetical protein